MSMSVAMAREALSPPTDSWREHGAGWPHRDASRFFRTPGADGLRWHAQMMGAGATSVLLLHGTGASTHSFRGLMPLLAERHSVIACDLPGMGFTQGAEARHLSLPGMAKAVAALLESLGVVPDVIVGHSAGAAIGLRMCLDGVGAKRLVSINGANLPLNGWAGTWFSPIARGLVAFPGVADLLAWRARADRALVAQLLRGTGSEIDDEGVELYARLFRRPDHVGATLGMMAAWDLPSLQRDLPRLAAPVTLVVGQRDQTIRPTEALRFQRAVPASRIIRLPELGHLAHEEDPAAVARAIEESSVA